VAINLTKGQRIEIGLSKVGVGLGWDPNESGGIQCFYPENCAQCKQPKGCPFDLDASAFMLGANKKLLQDEFFVFYNNPKSPDGAVESSGDDLTGGNSDGDDETLTVDLFKVDSRIQEIVFTVTIHEYDARRQNFGQVRNSFIRIYNAQTNEEIAKYDLDEDFSVETAVEFGRLYRRNGEWKFEAMGIGYKGGLEYFVKKYV
jgi:tellurium resistance protein TerD